MTPRPQDPNHFLHRLIEFGGVDWMELNHSWHGVNILSIIECALVACCLCGIIALYCALVKERRRLAVGAVVASMSFATMAYAANTALSNLTASGALAGGNLIYVVQTAGTGGVKATLTQVLTFIMSQISGDVTCASGGACTVGKVNGQTPVASVAGSCGNGPSSPSTGAVVVNAQITDRINTATSGGTANFASTDCGNMVYDNSTSAVAATIPVATTTGFTAGAFFGRCNISSGVVTITPTTSTIGGLSAWVLGGGSPQYPNCVQFQSDGTNYNIVSSGTFGPLVGIVTTQSGTTYTFAATDCGTLISFTSASAVTATIPQGLPVGCVIAVEQDNTAKVSVNGSAVTPATLHTHVASSAATGTGGQYAIINLTIKSTNVAILTGDGA